MTHIISILCHKGGVGKTTTAASLGGLLASSGEKVLLIDLDPQMNLTKTFTDGVFDDNIYKAFIRRRDLPIYSIRLGLDISPSHGDLCSLDMDLTSSLRREYILDKLLAPVRDDYDWIFIDCPAQMCVATTNALVASDSALVPMSCDAYSVDGLHQILSFIEMAGEANERLSVLGIAITRYKPRQLVDRAISEPLKEQWHELVFKTRIRESAAIVQAPLQKTDVCSYEPRSNGAKDYTALMEEIRTRIG